MQELKTMQKLNKKAVSGTVATVFLIAVVLVSGTILYNAIVPTIVSLAPEVSCTEQQLNPPVEIQNLCYNPTTGEIETTIKKPITSDTPLISLEFITVVGGKRSDWSCTQNCENCILPTQGNSQKYYFEVTGEGTPETLSTAIDGCVLETNEITLC